MSDNSTNKSSRRDFLKSAAAWAGFGLASAFGIQNLTGCSNIGESPSQIPSATLMRVPSPTPRPLFEAMYYRTLPNSQVQCQVCFRRCIVDEGKLGFCKNKKNVDGQYYSLVYGRPCALQVDPIEKEPSFHMLPGSLILCTGTASCNQRCKFCQNWEMSQQTLWDVWNYDAFPWQVVDIALEQGCDAVSFTYNEPTVFYEQMYETAEIAKKEGLGALFHTNGSMNPEPLFSLLETMDAITVDLKAFNPEFYQNVCSSELWPVQRTLQNVRKTDTHLEIVNLVIPSKNDDLEDIRRMCAWIAEKLGPETPLHFNRFFPAYKYQRLPPTPLETLEAAAGIAVDEGLKYVYIGNFPGHERNSTFCPSCGEKIIERVHFAVLSTNMIEGRCGFCEHAIPGVWKRDQAG